MRLEKRKGRLVGLLLLFCAAALALFHAFPGRSFASDDFDVIRRVGPGGVIRIKGFFRPLSDITLYLNYKIGGLDPSGYYLLNIFLHAACSWLFYLFCLRWKWTEEKEQQGFALIAALLFLTYPFHSEGIAWLLGRGASLSALFALGALWVAVTDLPGAWRRGWACLLYFIGMTAYESIMLLPLILLILLWGREPLRQYYKWVLALSATLVLHLLVRAAVSGGVMGYYGGGFFGRGWGDYAGNVLKVAGRLFLPPSDDTRRMLLLSGLVFVVVVILLAVFWKRTAGKKGERVVLLKWGGMLLLSCITPVLSGISTRTSESDRLLYFPSLFVCGLLALLLIRILGRSRALWPVVLLLLLYNTYFLERANRNWVRASADTRAILDGIAGEVREGRRVLLVNVPDETEGAFIFRMGLQDALLLKGGDTTRVTVVHKLTREEELGLPDSIRAGRNGDDYWIQPAVRIQRVHGDSLQVWGDYPGGEGQGKEGTTRKFQVIGPGDVLLYWNGQRLVRMK